MAKRSGATSTPSYTSLAVENGRTKNEGGFQRFIQEQILAPDKVAGNISVLVGTGFFAASIVATRLWGYMLLVPSSA